MIFDFERRNKKVFFYTDTVTKLTNSFIATIFAVLNLFGGRLKTCIQTQSILILSS